MPTFDEARLAALVQDLVAPLLGRPADLLPFDAVKDVLRLKHVVDRGVREVPVSAIAGTLGREHDFTRGFLPRAEALRGRWLEVLQLAHGPRGFPPVELYQVGDAYFVVDGHHRVSVAKTMGSSRIEAWVKEFITPVPLEPDESIEQVVLKSGLADFLEATGLQPDRVGAFRTTVPNGYERMLEHISVHRYFLGVDRGAPVPWDDAVRSWREQFYEPIVARIRESGLADAAGDLTEADLYLAAMDQLHVLREQQGAEAVSPARAADDVADLTRAHAEEERPLRRLRRWLRGKRRRTPP